MMGENVERGEEVKAADYSPSHTMTDTVKTIVMLYLEGEKAAWFRLH